MNRDRLLVIRPGARRAELLLVARRWRKAAKRYAADARELEAECSELRRRAWQAGKDRDKAEVSTAALQRELSLVGARLAQRRSAVRLLCALVDHGELCDTETGERVLAFVNALRGRKLPRGRT